MFHSQFANLLNSSASSYAETEAANSGGSGLQQLSAYVQSNLASIQAQAEQYLAPLVQEFATNVKVLDQEPADALAAALSGMAESLELTLSGAAYNQLSLNLELVGLQLSTLLASLYPNLF